jgi:large subunit ribosomal protein L15
MKLNELSPAPGSVKKRHRVGRGPGSGWGKTAGRGTKGQRSRAGYKLPPWFEGGQMPLQRRVPKRGFFNHFRKVYALVNIGQLEERFEDGAEVTEADLIAAGLVKKLHDGIKLLGQGELKKKLNVQVSKASGSAVAKVEAAGGSVTLTGGQVSEKVEE